MILISLKVAPIPINHAISFLSFRFLPSGLNDVSSGLTSPLDVLDSFGHQPGTLFSGYFQRFAKLFSEEGTVIKSLAESCNKGLENLVFTSFHILFT